MHRVALVPIACALAAGTAFAQESPYTVLQDRAIKARSAEEIDDLLTGRGMGYALAAELNGYPGPRHVLDLADSLALTDAQRYRIRALYDMMQHRAAAIGGRIVARERALDAAFATRRASTESIVSAAETIGMLEGRLRAVHLAAHIQVMLVLTTHQVTEYGRLRGYGAQETHDPGRHGH